jgi:hypothetical protein
MYCTYLGKTVIMRENVLQFAALCRRKDNLFQLMELAQEMRC